MLQINKTNVLNFLKQNSIQLVLIFLIVLYFYNIKILFNEDLFFNYLTNGKIAFTLLGVGIVLMVLSFFAKFNFLIKTFLSRILLFFILVLFFFPGIFLLILLTFFHDQNGPMYGWFFFIPFGFVGTLLIDLIFINILVWSKKLTKMEKLFWSSPVWLSIITVLVAFIMEI